MNFELRRKNQTTLLKRSELAQVSKSNIINISFDAGRLITMEQFGRIVEFPENEAAESAASRFRGTGTPALHASRICFDLAEQCSTKQFSSIVRHWIAIQCTTKFPKPRNPPVSASQPQSVKERCLALPVHHIAKRKNCPPWRSTDCERRRQSQTTPPKRLKLVSDSKSNNITVSFGLGRQLKMERFGRIVEVQQNEPQEGRSPKFWGRAHPPRSASMICLALADQYRTQQFS